MRSTSGPTKKRCTRLQRPVTDAIHTQGAAIAFRERMGVMQYQTLVVSTNSCSGFRSWISVRQQSDAMELESVIDQGAGCHGIGWSKHLKFQKRRRQTLKVVSVLKNSNTSSIGR